MFRGKSEEVLQSPPLKHLGGSVQLLFTSPPFPLNRKKSYGNHQGKKYVRWLASYAKPFKRCVGNKGSIVIELGNGWEHGRPTMSTLAMEALLAFKDAGKFHLCQEFICFNPARLPSPAQWVTIERCRVKDAFTRVWWLSSSPTPKADNRRILTSYSDSMKKLLERGTYNPGKRPSEHHVGATSFLGNNGGAIPPNVLVPSAADLLADLFPSGSHVNDILPIANTASGGDLYQAYCRRMGIEAHPARMPSKLVEFFIRFLTEPGDLVLDPFAGSNTTGAMAEQLARRWIGIEANELYATGSQARFLPKESSIPTNPTVFGLAASGGTGSYPR